MSTITNTNGASRENSKGAISVFLVDDDSMFLKSLEHHLQQKLKHNFKIKSFPTGEVCLKNMEQKPDIVVLDYFLNGQDQHAMNGERVLQRIKLTYPATTVIMLSGQDKMQVAVDSMRDGAFDYVVKNENVFLRTQNAIKNAVSALKMADQIKTYHRLVWILSVGITIVTIGSIIIHFFYNQVNEMFLITK